MNTILRKQFLAHVGQTSSSPMLVEVARAEGSFFYTPDGKRYYDLVAGVSVSNVGHCNPDVVRAVQEQAARYMHVMVYGEMVESPQVTYAARIAAALPAPLDSVYFVNSGAEAVEGALKLAKRYTGRTELVYYRNAYHGSTAGSLSVMGGEEYRNSYRPLLPDTRCIRFNEPGDLKYITSRTACVIIEPVQGEGGVRPASQEFLQGLRDLCDEKGILLMFDEVQVGSGRTGKLFAHQNYGVEPDTCSMAKALGSGVPIGAVCARGEAAKTLTPGTHGSTFAGGPLACALAATTLDVMINDGVIENSRKMGEYFRDQMHKVIEKNHPDAVNEIRGLGLIDGIQLNHPTGQPVVDLCFKDSNVLINNTNGNVLRFVPPLIVTEKEIDIVIKAVDDAMTKLGW